MMKEEQQKGENCEEQKTKKDNQTQTHDAQDVMDYNNAVVHKWNNSEEQKTMQDNQTQTQDAQDLIDHNNAVVQTWKLKGVWSQDKQDAIDFYNMMVKEHGAHDTYVAEGNNAYSEGCSAGPLGPPMP
jgi:hypothetical protein